jgi:hypothetical protein
VLADGDAVQLQGAAATAIRLKSAVPPPMSQTRTRSPGATSSVHGVAPGALADWLIQA